MAVFRVERNTGYTVMSNHHLRNKELSLKAKGLLSQMLSLPEDWDYTLSGLSYINRESIDAIRTAVWELEKAGYITRRQGRDEKGKMTAIEYTIYEQPQPPELDCPVLENPTADNPILENPTTDNPTSENPTQLNKDISRTNLPKKEKSNTDLSITHSIPIHSLNPLPYGEDEAAQPPERKRTERNDAYRVYEEIIKDNIEYDILLQDMKFDHDRLNEIVDLMLETVCTARKKIRIAGDDYPAELVKSKFMKLNSEHIRFVLDCMQENTTKIRNIKQYLKAVLFNAPSTIDSYYTAIPYGYKRINGDKQTLVVDEPAAEIVRKVFRLACQGMGVTAIAEQLTEEKVLIPSAYTAKYFPENCRNRSFSDPYRWNANTIGHILDRQEYLGHTVLGKSICENFKTKQRRAATPEELMIFPDTHEAIIDQDTWDIAQKLRVRAKPRAANGTYSHRLSGMIYCADCGSRMGFISPEARQSGKHYDSDSAFQCGNYRNQNNECVSHFIKTSALEAAILQAIKAVSQYVIENEAEFISQLKTVWNESKSKSANNGQQEIDEAKKRMAELDAKIQKLYDSAISGLLPERQAQRMIQQYDEEQLMLEKRVEELQGQIQEEEVEKIDTNRFIALVNKYRNCEELTDTMLYAFIDRVEVHEATGGRTVYRQQNIDIYFNFIGNYYPPVETVSEEERIAAIEAEQLRKKQEKAKRAA